jgi:hypothetical protein
MKLPLFRLRFRRPAVPDTTDGPELSDATRVHARLRLESRGNLALGGSRFAGAAVRAANTLRNRGRGSKDRIV